MLTSKQATLSFLLNQNRDPKVVDAITFVIGNMSREELREFINEYESYGIKVS